MRAVALFPGPGPKATAGRAARRLLTEARPTHDQALREAMHAAEQLPEFTGLRSRPA
jgi:hypothetical protein